MSNFKKELRDSNGRCCLMCGERKVWAEFVIDKKSSTGHGSRCRSCHQKKVLEYQATDKGKAAVKKASRMYDGTAHGRRKKREQGRRYSAKPDVREKKVLYDSVRRVSESQEDVDRRNIRRRELYADDPLFRARSNRKWKQANPEKVVIQGQRRRALILEAEGDFTVEDWQQVLQANNHRCAYCGVTGKMTIDHVVSLSRGGAHDIGNIVPACLSCNCKKHTSDWSSMLEIVSEVANA